MGRFGEDDSMTT